MTNARDIFPYAKLFFLQREGVYTSRLPLFTLYLSPNVDVAIKWLTCSPIPQIFKWANISHKMDMKHVLVFKTELHLFFCLCFLCRWFSLKKRLRSSFLFIQSYSYTKYRMIQITDGYRGFKYFCSDWVST